MFVIFQLWLLVFPWILRLKVKDNYFRPSSAIVRIYQENIWNNFGIRFFYCSDINNSEVVTNLSYFKTIVDPPIFSTALCVTYIATVYSTIILISSSSHYNINKDSVTIWLYR